MKRDHNGPIAYSGVPWFHLVGFGHVSTKCRLDSMSGFWQRDWGVSLMVCQMPDDVPF